MPFRKSALADTTRWLLHPGNWDNNRGDPGFSDKKLARIQFAAALAQAVDTGAARPARADRSRTIADSLPGGGRILAGRRRRRRLARHVWHVARHLHGAQHAATGGCGRVRESDPKTDQWFMAASPQSLLDAAASILALPGSRPVTKRSLDFILPAQTSDGGWGPHALAPPEPFDTAVVLLALRALDEPRVTRAPIARGRAFLIARQQAAGGWPETTRPPGSQSYAQHISTSGWATLALILTQ